MLSCNGYEIIDLGVMVPCDRILHAAREQGAQAVGLSGLITPSLEEMSHVAAEMERLGFATAADGATAVPLLIGGATTSRAHTAIKIAPNYSGPVVYVPDASRAVGVVTRLLSVDSSGEFIDEIAADYARLRAQHANKKGSVLVPLEETRANRFVWNADARYRPDPPQKPGLHVLPQVDLASLVPFIDWGPFFQTWDLVGGYPKILDDAVVGSTARAVFSDAKEMLAQVIAGKWLHAKAVCGLFPANAVGDDIEIYADESRQYRLMTWHNLRQQHERPQGKPHYCLSDFVADRGTPDWIGAFAVSAGFGIEEKLAEFAAAHDDYHSIMLKALADRLAEACAEWLHLQVRRDYWGYAAAENLDPEALIREEYRGIRPAPGYPACPDHTAKRALFDLLDVPRNTGMTLTESCAMTPAAAVSGFYLAHPQARYFAVSRIASDQLGDWAKRSGFGVEESRRWLAPLL